MEDAHVAKEDARLAMAYAQTISEWGRGMHNQYNNFQSFMKKMVEHTGMPSSAVPLAFPLPPPPPRTYGVSASQNMSPKNIGSYFWLGHCNREPRQHFA
uniref:Uncharacterized protein n=1 Tax=Arundo donax TaxID=35708 RepID=A0A0A9AQL8_ARUDO